MLGGGNQQVSKQHKLYYTSVCTIVTVQIYKGCKTDSVELLNSINTKILFKTDNTIKQNINTSFTVITARHCFHKCCIMRLIC